MRGFETVIVMRKTSSIRAQTVANDRLVAASNTGHSDAGVAGLADHTGVATAAWVACPEQTGTADFPASDIDWMLESPRKPMGVPGAHVDPELSSSLVPSFEDIYKQNFDFVWSSARYLGIDKDVVDDVVQDAFIVIHAKLATLQRPQALRSWIYGIVRRTASDYRRSKRTRDAAGARFGAELKLTQPSQTSPLEMAERNAELDLLEIVLAELDEPKREVFVMVEILEMTVPEVVRVLEIPLNTAYSRLRLARQSFEEALARQEACTEENGRRCRTLVPENRPACGWGIEVADEALTPDRLPAVVS
jgi:RNA polymerase sigma-70 factor (ECF subfamily)